jgi:hypothetical protein
MHDAADAYIDAQPWPDGDGAFVMSRDKLRGLIERSYTAGYAQGRESVKQK